MESVLNGYVINKVLKSKIATNLGQKNDSSYQINWYAILHGWVTWYITRLETNLTRWRHPRAVSKQRPKLYIAATALIFPLWGTSNCRVRCTKCRLFCNTQSEKSTAENRTVIHCQQLVANYRPISVLTAVSKLNESVMNDQLGQYFINIFHELLCAFRKKYSCQSTLANMIEDWKESLDKNNVIGALFMDLSKAFDSLPHGLLIAKFRAYGLSLSACDLLSSYLSNRHQRVKIKGSRSEWRELKKGVPQGSILGPLLFNVFVNDMFHFVDKCSLYNYADDNSISTASPCVHDVVSNLKTDCNNIMEWFSVNGLQANPSKFQFMLLSSSDIDNSNISLCIDDITLKPEPHVKLLGVFLDDKLSFSQHVSISCTKAARQLNALARISRYLNISSRSLLYNSIVRSNFNYCAMVWHFCGKTNNNKIENIQERALRIIYRDYESSYEDLLSAAEAPTMWTRRLRVILLEVFKSINMLNSDCLNDMFQNQRWELLFLQHKEALTTKKENNHIWAKKYCLSRCQIMEWQYV